MCQKRNRIKPKDMEYKAKKILKKRITVQGNVEYLLKWKKFGKSEISWEPVEKLNCSKLIEAYENYFKSTSKKRKKTADNIKIAANNSKNTATRIDSLPEDILIEIFSYFTQNELGRFALVCKKWNMCTKNPILWKNINVKFRCVFGSTNEMVSIFSERIPTCVRSMVLNFTESRIWRDRLHFEEFCMDLQKRCPNLQSLILISTKLSVDLTSVIDICSHCFPELEVLALRSCYFGKCITKEKYNDSSKIKIFDIHFCISIFYPDLRNSLSKMPNLRKLYADSSEISTMFFDDDSLLQRLEVLEFGWSEISQRMFEKLFSNACNLTELYLCGAKIEIFGLIGRESRLTRLKTICLYATDTNRKVIRSLIQSCPVLETVYVMQDLVKYHLSALPEFIRGESGFKCMSNIIKGVRGCNHRAHYLMKF